MGRPVKAPPVVCGCRSPSSFCRGFGCLRLRGFLRLWSVRIQIRLIVRDGLVQLVDFCLRGIAGGEQVGVLAVGVQGGLGVLQFSLCLGQAGVGLVNGSLRIDELLRVRQRGLGGGSGFISDAACQQGGLFGQGLLAAVGGGQAQGLAVVAAPDRDKALARGHGQRRAVGGGQAERPGGVLLAPGDLLPRAAVQVEAGAAGHVVLAGVAVILDAAGRIQHKHVGERRLLAYARGRLSEAETRRFTAQLLRAPEVIKPRLADCEQIKYLASRYVNTQSCFFIGRGFDYALSLEGSLKLKEISYVHSDAYAAGELKHGTISLITDGVPVIALATQKQVYEKTISNAKETRSRGARVLLFTTKDAVVPEGVADAVIRLDEYEDILMPLQLIVPLQLFAYYMAVLRGCDVDKPRNLAKSVTVE